MKFIFILILTSYSLYNYISNNCNNNIGSCELIKYTKILTLKQYYERVKRKRRNHQTPVKNNSKQTYILWLLILCGNVELNPGPINCTTCNQIFTRPSRLNSHVAKAVRSPCEHCTKVFCSENRMQQHKLTDHVGGAVHSPETEDAHLDMPIFPDNGHASTAEYQQMIDEHYETIRTNTTQKNNWKKINQKLSVNFTYRDLKQLLDEVRRDEYGVFKINIGFGSMLYNTVNHTYRYFYVSTNHYLFDRAYTISTNRDMTNFFKKILSLDLADKYYFQRPSSG